MHIEFKAYILCIYQQINESVSSIQSPQNDLQLNASASKVTVFPTELLDPIKNASANATDHKADNTSQPSQNNTASQSLSSSTTMPILMAN